MAVRINLIRPMKSFMRSELPFGPKGPDAPKLGWTWSLIFEIASPGSKNYTEGINNFLKKQGLNRTQLSDMLADELLQSLKGVSRKILNLEFSDAQKAVRVAARHFIQLADLSHAKDTEFVDFIVNTLIRALTKHLRDNAVHSGVVTFHAAAMAKELGFSEKDMRRIRTAGDLHDIGKVGCPAGLLNKVGFTPEDKTEVDKHLEIGVFFLEEIKYFWNVAEIIKHHHSHQTFDEDYTPELMGKDLYTLAQILRVADEYDGMTSKRKYKTPEPYVRFDNRIMKVFSKAEAFEQLLKGGHDKTIVAALERVLEKGEYYIFNIKELFPRGEIKFVWPGIHHLIEKTILPSGGKEEVSPADVWLLPRAPLLWLISEQKKGFVDVFAFVSYIRWQVISFAKGKGVDGRLKEAMEAIKKDYAAYNGVVYEVLFRARNADMKMHSNAFVDIVNFLAAQSGNITKLIKGIDMLYPEPEKNEEAFFQWLASRLYGESTESVPLYGERAFIEFTKKMCGGNKG